MDIKKKKTLLLVTKPDLPEIIISSYNYFMISYIIEISFSRTNTFLCVKTGCGDLITFCSAGSLIKEKKIKKTKVNRKLVLKKIFAKLVRLSFLKHKPISLHMINFQPAGKRFIKQLTKLFFVKSIQIFNAYPFNGCRERKKRRKKIRKKRIRRR